jgi:hypothetical protein
MIPILGLMIALYGSARLLNDIGKRYPRITAFTVITWAVGLLTIAGLWLLALLMNLPNRADGL